MVCLSLRLSSTNFIWSILEYFVPFVILKISQQLTFSSIVIFTFVYEPIWDKLKEIVNHLQELFDQIVTETLLYGSPNLKGNQNLQIWKCTIK